MKLTEVIQKLKVVTNKDELEELHTLLSTYLSELQTYKATLEKEEALFMGDYLIGLNKSVAQRKVEWKASSSGQKLIGVKGEVEAVKPLINSVKSKLYTIY